MSEERICLVHGKNFATIGKVTLRAVETFVKHAALGEPFRRDGKTYRYMVWVEELDGGTRTVLRRATTTSKALAARLGRQWAEELFPARSCAPPPPAPQPPANCEPITPGDETGRLAAIGESLARLYPRTVALMRLRRSGGGVTAAQLKAAYLQDVAAFSGRVIEPTSSRDARELAAALAAYDRRGTPPENPVPLALCLRWFEKGWCYLRPEPLAAAVNAEFGTRYTPAAILKLRQRLGLPCKRRQGPPPIVDRI